MSNLNKEQIQATQYLHDLSPDTLLSLDQAAPLLGKKPSTLRNDVTRLPADSLPILTRLPGSRRVFIKKSDIDEFKNRGRQVAETPAPEKRVDQQKGGAA